MTATILSTTVSGNSQGGVSSVPNIFSGGATVTITDCTISSNFSAPGGGGIFGTHTFLSVANSTISGNSTPRSGGGISVSGGLVIENSTISGNSGTSGGGIYNTSSLIVRNTILNVGASGENIFNDGGTVTSLGYNLSSDDAGGYLTGAQAIRSISIHCLAPCGITAAQPLRTRCCLAAQRLTPAIRTSVRRLSTTSEAVLSIACSMVASI